MKLKTIERFVKKTGMATVTDGPDELWIGNGAMLAPVYEFRRLDDAQLRAVLNISEKEAEKISISRYEAAPDELADEAPGEELLGLPLLSLTLGDRTYDVYESARGCVYVNAELLRPFAAELKEGLRVFLRRTDAGEILAVKRGFFLAGLIVPSAHVINPALTDTLEALLKGTMKRIEQDATEPTLFTM